MWEGLCENLGRVDKRAAKNYVKQAQLVRGFMLDHDPDAKFSRYYSLRHLLRLLRIYDANAITFRDEATQRALGSGVYRSASLFNHSCSPNCAATFSNDGSISVTAIEAIAEGEELRISYIDQALPLRCRHKALYERWQFVCTCERCASAEAEEIDRRVHGFYCPMSDCSSLLVPLRHPGTGRCTGCGLMSADINLQSKFKSLADVNKLVLAQQAARGTGGANEAGGSGHTQKLKQVLIVELACMHPMNQSVAQTLRMLRDSFSHACDYDNTTRVSEVSWLTRMVSVCVPSYDRGPRGGVSHPPHINHHLAYCTHPTGVGRHGRPGLRHSLPTDGRRGQHRGRRARQAGPAPQDKRRRELRGRRGRQRRPCDRLVREGLVPRHPFVWSRASDDCVIYRSN